MNQTDKSSLAHLGLPPVEWRRGECSDLAIFLASRIYEYNSEVTGCFDTEAFGVVQRDQFGSLIGGASGHTWCGCCFVSNMWVASNYRGAGIGRALMSEVESNALAKGCAVVLLSSHTFQSPGFYERLGYVEQARVVDHPIGHADVFYAKRFTPSAD